MGRELRVLVVDDEPNIRKALSICLRAAGCEVRVAAGEREALEAVRLASPDLVLLDLRLGEADGLALLPRIRELRPDAAVVVMTAYATIETAVSAMRAGAVDYLPKPFSPDLVRAHVDRVRRVRVLEARVRELEGRVGALPDARFAAESPAMSSVLDVLERAASSDAAILLQGESGSGKSELARWVHSRSARAGGPFVTVSCPTLTAELLASEIFGHVRGAFTGATADRIGRVEEAAGGTLFLDEIGDMPAELQAKLLRVLQEREFERVGETRTRGADVRVLAATHRDLEAEVAAGRFREDLLYRLAVIRVVVPPLRERREEVLPTARHFLAFFGRQLGRPALELDPGAEEALLAYPWPGNVRELRNELERAAVLATGPVLHGEELSERLRAPGRPAPWIGGEFTLAEIERAHVDGVLARCSGREEAARQLGIDPSTLWRKLKRYEAEDAAP